MMLVDQIRATTAEVVKKAKHVTIIPSKIPEIIKLLEEEEDIASFFDFDCHIDKSAPEEDITSKTFILSQKSRLHVRTGRNEFLFLAKRLGIRRLGTGHQKYLRKKPRLPQTAIPGKCRI
jgi:hypothetical protein